MATDNNRQRKRPQLSPELGFGTKASERHQRLVNPDGSFNVRRRGTRKLTLSDAYHTLIALGWWKFFGIIGVGFLFLNLFFGTIYYLLGSEHLIGMIGSSSSDKFWESFFFSSQTLTTVGYGRVSPVGFWVSAVAAVESAIGLLSFALSTSLLWGRFSRPTAKVFYSRNALVAPYKEGRGLMFRTVNGGRSQIVELEAVVTLARNEKIEGKEIRKFYRLKLELDKLNFLPTSWTLVHPIDEESPLYLHSKEELDQADTEVLIMMKAFDESYSQTVYSRMSYTFHQIIYGAKFMPMTQEDDDGRTMIDLDKLNAYETKDLPKEAILPSE